MTPAKILVVDDEAHIVHVVALKLRNAGYVVVTASDGEEALELALNELPDLVITDLQMPYLSGLQLCEKLRESKELASVPAMMLTARGYSIAEEDLARTNIRTVLSKPFSPREVLERTKELLAERDGSATGAEAA